MTTKTNPAQWPSFENWSVKYASHAQGRIRLLEVNVTLLQRWWRQRFVNHNRRRLYPIVFDKRAYSVRLCSRELQKAERGNELLHKFVWCYEKLDGTNLGVRCDGVTFGRRQLVTGDSYQKVPLSGILPDADTIAQIKERLLAETTKAFVRENAKLLVYGELMCNPGRYCYDPRGMGKRWYAFGAILQTHNLEASDAEQMLVTLVSNGYLASMSPDASKITIRLNDKLSNLFTECSLSCVPFLVKGALKQVCVVLKDKLLDTKLQEGVVITGLEFLVKWKTSLEDESKGYDMLTCILRDFSNTIFELCGVDREMVELLMAVSKRENEATRRSTTKPVRKKERKNVIADDVLATAYTSALTKFDAVESYFARDARSEIIALLVKEVAEEMNAKTPEQRACVTNFVKKKVGRAFGSWLKEK